LRDALAPEAGRGAAGLCSRGVPDASVWLGRPWRAGGNIELLGAATFLHCWMDGHITPEGWTAMGYKLPSGYQMYLQAGDARFAEYGSTGPGARRHPGRRVLTPFEARAYTRAAVFGDWRPA
jgi:pectinesterase